VTDRRPKTKMRGDAKGTSESLETIRIRLLGGFEVTVGTQTIEEGAWRLRKAANLVKLRVGRGTSASAAGDVSLATAGARPPP
jgi:hypothetical protein